VVEVSRQRERAIPRQIKAQDRWNIGDISRSCNAERPENYRSQQGSTFTTDC